MDAQKKGLKLRDGHQRTTNDRDQVFSYDTRGVFENRIPKSETLFVEMLFFPVLFLDND